MLTKVERGNGMDIQKLDKYEQINLAIYLTKLFPKETEALTAVFEKKVAENIWIGISSFCKMCKSIFE